MSSLKWQSFNTSHVTLYRGIWCWFCCRGSVSIHLMLLFIVSPIKLTFVFALFQYISCYSLSCTLSICLSTFAVSIHLMLLFINVRVRNPVHYDGFNTSHVTLYHFCIQTIKRLLHRFNTSHVTLYRFNTIFFCLGFDVSIHLMLLFIRRLRSSAGRQSLLVSIHLMLLFIIVQISEKGGEIVFQYISCYSLSFCIQTIKRLLHRFNTSHVTLYRNL